jgi:hypothetical protein
VTPIQRGQSTTSASGNTIAFDVIYPTTPYVYCTAFSNTSIVTLSNVTPSNFTVQGSYWNGSAITSGNIQFNWMAIPTQPL